VQDARIYSSFCIRAPQRFEAPPAAVLRKTQRRNRRLTFASIVAAGGIMLATSHLSAQFAQPAPQAGICQTPAGSSVCAPGEASR
jgi:hypothetical protein